MSVRSVDLATTLAQTQHAERVNQLEHGQARTQQHQFAQELQQAGERRQHTVEEAPEDQEARRTDHEEQRRKATQTPSRRRKRRQEQPPAEGLVADDDLHFIDLHA